MQFEFNRNHEALDLSPDVVKLCEDFETNMIDRRELYYLAMCVMKFNWKPNSFIIEIGTYKGRTAAFLGKLVKILGISIKIVSIDPFESAEDEYLNSKGVLSEYLNTIRSENVEDICFPIIGSSQKVYDTLKPSVGVLFIDGSHTYENAKSDIKNYSQLLCQGGYIFVDDYDEKNYPGVKKAFDEWLQNQNDYELAHKDEWFILAKLDNSSID